VNFDFDVRSVGLLLDRIVTLCSQKSVIQTFLRNPQFISLMQYYTEIVLDPLPPMVYYYLTLVYYFYNIEI
jgi:hypothetical protein